MSELKKDDFVTLLNIVDVLAEIASCRDLSELSMLESARGAIVSLRDNLEPDD